LIGLSLFFVRLRRRLGILEERAESAEGRTARIVSFLNHDLRASVHGIAGIARLLEKTPCSAEQQEYAQLMRYTSLKIHYTAAELVDCYRKRRRKEPLVESDFSPGRYFKKETGFLRRYVSEKGCTLDMELPPDRDRTFGDKTKLGRLTFALVSAAVERSPESGLNLEVTLTFSGLELRITVRRKSSPEVFTGGSELHIETARVLAAALGGTLTVEGYAGPFSVRLPLGLTVSDVPAGNQDEPLPLGAVPGEDAVSGKASGPLEGASSGGFDGAAPSGEPEDSAGVRPRNKAPRRPRLLIAEDEVINQFYLKNICAEAGWKADVVGNGQEAVRRFEKGGYDLVILDIEMPILSGVDTVRRMRELESGDRTPIIALSAYSGVQKTTEYTSAGFDGHLSKPFTERGFYRKVEQFMTGRANTS
jgi:CheY-like chemotaxis protein